MKVGALVAAGRTSDVYAYGTDSVVKVLRPGVEPQWAQMEARFTAAVRELGVPAPAVRGLVTVDGRDAVVFQRIDGRSMLERMVANRHDTAALARELAAVHEHILSAGLPTEVHGLVDRMCAKLEDAVQLRDGERAEAGRMVRSLPRGAALLHGDLHPGNVLMSAAGPVVIDWFDAAIGHPVADVVRSSLLVRPAPDEMQSPHLPGADAATLAELHSCYVISMGKVLAVDQRVLRLWESVTAASRLAEHAQADDVPLIALWRNRDRAGMSPLIETLSGAGLLVAGLEDRGAK